MTIFYPQEYLTEQADQQESSNQSFAAPGNVAESKFEVSNHKRNLFIRAMFLQSGYSNITHDLYMSN